MFMKISRKNGFTLVELLVVISIIAMLLAILMPSLAKVRNAGRAVVCGSQLRQLQIAAQMYSRDNKDRILPGYQPNGVYCWQLLNPYMPTNLWVSSGDGTNRHVTMRCPGFVSKYAGKASLNWWGSVGYGTNLHFNSASGIPGNADKVTGENFKNPAKLGQIKRTASTVQFYDNDSIKSNSAAGGYCDSYSGASRGAPHFYSLWKAHGDQFNVVMFDNHVERVRFNPSGRYKGEGSGDYSQFTWLSYGPYVR
jgi:prepilin-type N-terminal cleavage/methylation domain-containing protein/prepilin-type processing-associated H-X9-DG protein